MNRRLVGWMVAAMMCIGMASGPSRAFAAAGVDAFEQNKRLGRGVNVIGYDPLWRDRNKGRFQTE